MAPQQECEVVTTLLPSNPPVVGCPLDSEVVVRYKGDGTLEPPQYKITYKWFRQAACNVHRSRLATLMCNDCLKRKVPVEESCHCSTSCFKGAWSKHLERHRRSVDPTMEQTTTGGRLRSCGSWPDLTLATDGRELGDDALLEGGEVWIKIGSSQTYEPRADDAGFILRLECLVVDAVKGTELAPVSICLTDVVIFTFPDCYPRRMIEMGSKHSHICSDGLTFSVLQYNILADVVSGGAYNYCRPQWPISWKYRSQNLLKEIIQYDADIVCLQEVQDNHFERFFQSELIKHGYSVMYKKQEITRLFTYEHEYASQGCAIFYRHALFKVIMKYELDFDQRAQFVMEHFKPELREQVWLRLRKDNVALIVVLETIRNGLQYRICVANTHIFANTKFPDTKLFQVVELVRGLEKIAQANIPLLICADLNSLPESDHYRFLVRGRVDLVSREEDDPLGICHRLKLEHSLGLVSAYTSFFDLQGTGTEENHLNKMDHNNREPLFTNFTNQFSGTLDYILYTEGRLSVEALLELLDAQSLGSGIPSFQWSSDHIALKATFRLKPPEPYGPLPQEI